MYLISNAKLWWRTKYDDIQKGRCHINSWEDLRGELKTQFFLENVDYMAQKKLFNLKQIDQVIDYVKQFLALILNIHDMLEKETIFFFLERLKSWARTELQRQRVQDLGQAQDTAKRLPEYLGKG